MSTLRPTRPAARAAAALSLALGAPLGACGGASTPPPELAAPPPAPTAEREAPPESGPAREVAFPPIVRETLDNGLEVNAVEVEPLPVLYTWLVVESGGETDPEALPGLSKLVAGMLEEGTRRKTSAQLAEAVEFLGADLSTFADEENVYVVVRSLAEHAEEAMALLAEVATQPAFRADELAKLKRRELDRLALELNDPNALARRAVARGLYGDHPYAVVDTTVEAVERVKRSDLTRWHGRYVVPNNAFLAVVGSVEPERVIALARDAFGGWRRGAVPEPVYPEPPTRAEREIVVVDRPESVQSVVTIANLALPRDSDDFVDLMVANQVLGGSAASRLFMDLRERRSLTYGAYSRVDERVRVAPFTASAAVRTEVTPEAMGAFFEHLDRIVTEPAPAEELADAKRYLSDSFPLRIDTPGKIAGLVADLRVFGLPDDYWEGYRADIRGVTAEEALAAARAHIHPDRALVVVVGKASEIAPALRQWGRVTVVRPDGTPVPDFDPGEG